MNISVIIPLLNESESLPELHRLIQSEMNEHNYSYEILFIDDGSTDDSWETILNISKKDENVKGIKFRRNYGKSQALNAGFSKAQGAVIITIDADLQDDPKEISGLYKMILDEDYDLVSGWKKKRYDHKLTKNLPSKLFNWAARKTSGIYLNDFNCGLKAYKKEVIKNVDVYGEMHRYIPVLAKNKGFTNIGEKVVVHQARIHGESKFGTSRFINGFLDLITLWFTGRFGKRPMHFFGLIGSLMFLAGFISAFGIGALKIYKLIQNQSAILVTNNPFFYIALTFMVLGVQLFLAGFLGEIIIKTKRSSSLFEIETEIK